MIYLVTAHDRQKRISHIDQPEYMHTYFWKSVLNLTMHKTVMYGMDTFNALNRQPLVNRVNICFARQSKKVRSIPNVLFNNNIREIIATFSGNRDDIYVIGSTRTIIEMFAKDADYIIDYSTEELGHTSQIIFDSINFADYNLLKKQTSVNFDIRYFVREKTNFIGY